MLFGCDGFFAFTILIFVKNGLTFPSLSLFGIFPVRFVHQFIEILCPSFSNYWFEDFILFRKLKQSSSEEIIKNIMSFVRSNFSKKPIIISFSSSLIRKSIKSFIYFNKFLLSFSIVWIVFRMIFQCQFSISFFNIFKASISGNAKDCVVILTYSIGIMGFEKFLFIFIDHTIFFKKFLKCIMSILVAVFFLKKFVIMSSATFIRQDIISLRNVVEFFLCESSISFMFIRMPLSGQLLISFLNVKCGGINWNFKYFIVILQLFTHFN